MKTLGDFSSLVTPYAVARRGFDERVFSYIEAICGELSGKHILDVGCGTGIATRQLQEYGAIVIGSDTSLPMIREASRASKDIKYIVTPTDTLPFDEKRFDLVTAFSAFHWFDDTESVSKIKRVLKPGGWFTVINKHDTAGIRKDVVSLFQKYSKTTSGKSEYDPEKTLQANGFQNTNAQTFQSTERFAYEEAMKYLQSIALWNKVSDSDRGALLSDIKMYCRNTLEKIGTLTRTIDTIVVMGQKEI